MRILQKDCVEEYRSAHALKLIAEGKDKGRAAGLQT